MLNKRNIEIDDEKLKKEIEGNERKRNDQVNER